MAGADLAVLVNPNNPDGRCWPRDTLLALAQQVGFLVVDESFADVTPRLSLLPCGSGASNLLILRSFGKFYGLAGLRLGFAFGARPVIARLADMAGPWPVSGGAIAVGAAPWQMCNGRARCVRNCPKTPCAPMLWHARRAGHALAAQIYFACITPTVQQTRATTLQNIKSGRGYFLIRATGCALACPGRKRNGTGLNTP